MIYYPFADIFQGFNDAFEESRDAVAAGLLKFGAEPLFEVGPCLAHDADQKTPEHSHFRAEKFEDLRDNARPVYIGYKVFNPVIKCRACLLPVKVLNSPGEKVEDGLEGVADEAADISPAYAADRGCEEGHDIMPEVLPVELLDGCPEEGEHAVDGLRQCRACRAPIEAERRVEALCEIYSRVVPIKACNGCIDCRDNAINTGPDIVGYGLPVYRFK